MWKNISMGGRWSGEFYNKRKDGSYYWESAVLAPIKNDKNQIVNYVKSSEGVSRRKLLENQLTKAKIEAEESDKLKSAFLTHLSHEVRTLLNGIIGFTDLLINTKNTSEERKEFRNLITTYSEQLMMMMNDILKISKIEAGKLSIKYTSFCVEELLEEVCSFYSFQLEGRNVKIKKRFLCDLKSIIRSDRKRIRQVIDNLVRNAIKFTSEGSITIGGECKNNLLMIFVEDTGIGIAPVHQRRIFERFRQVEEYSTRQYEGTGLGLAISEDIVKLLGGEIWVESQEGHGAKFIFTVPFDK